MKKSFKEWKVNKHGLAKNNRRKGTVKGEKTMIIKEERDTIIFIEQDEHALISGRMINKWQSSLFLGEEWRSSVEYAVTRHDRSWIPLDRKFLFLKNQSIPADFTEYPLENKIKAYKRGIEQLVSEDLYAGYLLSCHYASFFKGKNDVEGKTFTMEEEQRQEKLLKEGFSLNKELTADMRHFHFNLLQFCDNLSLYLCMNPWGIDKDNELAWFKEGFPQQLSTLNGQQLYSTWESKTTVKLNPFPFVSERLHISIPYKRLDKQKVKESTVQKVYQETAYRHHPIIIKKSVLTVND